MTDDEIRIRVQAMRRVASKVGPMHAWWDVIFDAEALLAGQHTICSREDIESELRKVSLDRP